MGGPLRGLRHQAHGMGRPAEDQRHRAHPRPAHHHQHHPDHDAAGVPSGHIPGRPLPHHRDRHGDHGGVLPRRVCALLPRQTHPQPSGPRQGVDGQPDRLHRIARRRHLRDEEGPRRDPRSQLDRRCGIRSGLGDHPCDDRRGRGRHRPRSGSPAAQRLDHLRVHRHARTVHRDAGIDSQVPLGP